MFKVLHCCRPHLTGIIVGRHPAPFICKKLIECSINAQKIPLMISCRPASSKVDLSNQELIYTGMLGKKVWGIKVITLTTSILSIPFQIALFIYHPEVMKHVSYQIFLMSCIAFQSVMPLVIHFVAKRYVIRIYYNSATDEYTMVTYGLLPREKYTTFGPDEARLPDVEIFSSVVIKEKYPVFFDSALFSDVQHYKRLMGYDKPIKLVEESEENVAEDTKRLQEPENEKKSQ